MIKWSFIISAVSFALLVLPDWRPPYTYLENFVILLGYIGMFGPWFLIVAAVLNRLINISLRIR